MSTLREAAQQALEALEWAWGGEPIGTMEREAITALRAALAQEEQEPVLTINKLGSLVECSPTIAAFALPDGEFSLYTHPPRREWQGLTEEERVDILFPLTAAGASDMDCARAIEQALKERNNG